MLKAILTTTISILALTLLVSTSSYAITKEDAKRHFDKVNPQDAVQPYAPESGAPGKGGLTGYTSVGSVETSSKSPAIYGAVPSHCNDVGVIILPDTANLDTGEGLFVYSGDLSDAEVYNTSKYWTLNTQEMGLSLINGKYNVYVQACDEEGADGGPLYYDLYYDKIFIYPTTCDATCTPVHRFYNKKNGAHFYTSVEHEKRTVMENKATYNYEGIANFARTSNVDNLTSVHRFYHKQNGTHFYTSNQAEASNVNNTMSGTYRYEGVSYYSYKSPGTSKESVHRFYKFKQGVHFYTSNQAEASNVNNTMSGTYRYEGVSYYNIKNN